MASLTDEEQRAVSIAATVLKTTRPDVATVLNSLVERATEEVAEEAAEEAAAADWWAARKGVSWGIPR